MKLATSPGGVYFHRIQDECEKIRMLHQAGFSCLDFSFWAMKPDSPFMTDGWKAASQQVRACMDELGMEGVQAHSPMGNPLNKNEADWMLHNTAQSLRCSAVMGIPHVVVHAGSYNGISREEFFEANRTFYRKLIPYIEETGVNVLIENIGIAGQDPYYLITGQDLREMIDLIDHPGFHALWDVGHGNINGLDQYDNIVALGEELHGLHIQDNFCRSVDAGNGWLKDAHTFPGTGTVNFDAVMQGLLDSGYKGCFTFEVDAPSIFPKKPFYKDGEKVDRLSALSMEIKLDSLRLVYKTGKYFVEQFGFFEK